MKPTIAVNMLASMMMGTTNADTTGKVWVLASSGIHIFSPDGKEQTLHRHQDEVCQETPTADDPGLLTTDCRYVEGVDDGEHYVWVSNSRLDNERPENHRYYMDAYDRSTAELVASIPTCSVVRAVKYASHRREIWNNCWINTRLPLPDEGQIDVFSTSAFGLDHQKVVLGDEIKHEHGDVFIHEALPLMAFGFSTAGGTLFEIEPNTKEVVKEIEIPDSKAGGEFAFSKINKHLFIRIYNDCSCGIEKDTGVACEESAAQGYKGLKNVTVITGPNASPDPQLGFSGKFCRGSKADTQGVWEYEPSSRKFLAKHRVGLANGAKPFVTPNGELVLLAAGDGSNLVKVLKPGQKGKASKEVGTINLTFGNLEGKHDASDIGFLEIKDELYAIFTSVLHNHVMVAALNVFYSATTASPVTIESAVDIQLHAGTDSSARWDPRGINIRRVRIIPGSPYIWVDATEIDQVFVVELDQDNLGNTRIVKSLDGMDSKDIVYVTGDSHPNTISASPMLSSNENNNGDTLAIASMILSLLALFAAVASLATAGSRKNIPVRIGSVTNKDPESLHGSISSDLPSIK